MRPEIYIGIDIGTTRIKAVATGTNLESLAESTSVTPWVHQKNLSEIELNVLAATVIETASVVADKVNGKVIAIGITGFSETGALIDTDGNPLAPGLAWHDPRGFTEPIVSKLGEFEFRSRAGVNISNVVSLAKTLWLNENFPDSKSANHFLSTPEWIAFKLSGVLVNELSLVSRTGFFDVVNRIPWLEAIKLVGGGSDFLGRLVTAGDPLGIVTGNVPKNLRGAVVTIAGHDHITAAKYCGATIEGLLFDSIGTAEGLLRTVATPLTPHEVAELTAANVGYSCSVVPDHYTILGGLPTGLTLERTCALLGIATLQEKVSLGNEAALIDPAASSMRVVNDYYGLSITNLDDAVSPAALFRATTEHLIENSKKMVAVIEKFAGKSTQVMIAGGWINNPMMAAAKLKQYGPYQISDVAEAGAMGAAQFAKKAVAELK